MIDIGSFPHLDVNLEFVTLPDLFDQVLEESGDCSHHGTCPVAALFLRFHKYDVKLLGGAY